jgi:hypothetical protein
MKAVVELVARQWDDWRANALGTYLGCLCCYHMRCHMHAMILVISCGEFMLLQNKSHGKSKTKSNASVPPMIVTCLYDRLTAVRYDYSAGKWRVRAML